MELVDISLLFWTTIIPVTLFIGYSISKGVLQTKSSVDRRLNISS